VTITTDTAPADHGGPPGAAEAAVVPQVDEGPAVDDVTEVDEVDDALVADDEVLLEEISIDGMCGVY
jgi:mycofactocin precursor